jgi:error-prone DNA polymerase
VSSWLKCHHPAVFTCALLNSQPMGFYAPAQLVRDAQDHGVTVRGVDVNASDWDCTLEGHEILRLGFSRMDGFRREWAQSIVQARADGPFSAIEEVARRTGLWPRP